MKSLPAILVVSALMCSTVSLQAQSSDEERRKRMEERIKRAGGRPGDNAPKVGSQAPDLGVRKKLNGEEIDLSDPNKISVLVFGSHT